MEFLENLRNQPRPDDVFDDDEDDFIDSPPNFAAFKGREMPKRSNSLLSRAFEQLALSQSQEKRV
jgi:hypothetical protein